MNAKQIASLINVSPRSTGRAAFALDSIKERAFAETRYTQGTDASALYYHIGETAQRAQHATATGRINGEAICCYREMTPYRVCKLVATLAQQVQSWSELIEDDATAVIRQAIMEG
jgi:hypothetical protein